MFGFFRKKKKLNGVAKINGEVKSARDPVLRQKADDAVNAAVDVINKSLIEKKATRETAQKTIQMATSPGFKFAYPAAAKK